ncbi:hypothetical protein SAMD00079811_81750 (plasmid) [Scytonema sp. HK-05]|uniref:hypothetical protein n=1 Tax=Scytonema sp. HK-05 TaxID=1137095 RepID=UPI0009377DF7|nr:hypothetical protein [Scytonema sp. HK-05]OKH58154.1 hypothetical protein NIES2130_15800 [Scytonema sp. HK-05]BAY50546.1 hypothetical protein SAMD00079811_81750 [Scytonema sp. HK-05]
MKTGTIKRLIAGTLTIGMIGRLRSQPLFALPVSQAQRNPSQDYVLPYRGSWTGTFRTVGSQGQILVFIDPSGKLYGSLKSNDGENFAQISGYHRGSTFHMVFTPPPSSLNQFGTASPYTVDGTAEWEQGVRRFVISAPTRTGHSQLYTFERLSNR